MELSRGSESSVHRPASVRSQTPAPTSSLADEDVHTHNHEAQEEESQGRQRLKRQRWASAGLCVWSQLLRRPLFPSAECREVEAELPVIKQNREEAPPPNNTPAACTPLSELF